MTDQDLLFENQDLPRGIEVFEIGSRRLYVKTGPRSFAISEDDLTPTELIRIARDIALRQAKLSERPAAKAFGGAG